MAIVNVKGLKDVLKCTEFHELRISNLFRREIQNNCYRQKCSVCLVKKFTTNLLAAGLCPDSGPLGSSQTSQLD